MFTKDELKRFFKACDGYRHSLKYKAMFMTVYGGGLRVSELCNLRIQDIDSENMRILVREGKESKYRECKTLIFSSYRRAMRFFLSLPT